MFLPSWFTSLIKRRIRRRKHCIHHTQLVFSLENNFSSKSCHSLVVQQKGTRWWTFRRDFSTVPRVWQTDFSCPVIFVQFFRKSGVLDVRFELEFGNFFRNIEDSEKICSWKFTQNQKFYHLFLRNLGGKSSNSSVWSWSLLANTMQRRNCSLNTQEQPLFWDKCNKNLTIRHLQRAK